ncbi:MAG: DUF1289 domain-containing protein [Rubripirellula sp.]
MGICESDPSGICRGCFRSLSEIARWTQASPRERLDIIRSAKSRQNATCDHSTARVD